MGSLQKDFKSEHCTPQLSHDSQKPVVYFLPSMVLKWQKYSHTLSLLSKHPVLNITPAVPLGAACTERHTSVHVLFSATCSVSF